LPVRYTYDTVKSRDFRFLYERAGICPLDASTIDHMPSATTLQPLTRALVFLAIVATILVGCAGPLAAQGVELTPMGGYRFGGDLFEIAAGHRFDIDGAPAVGLALDVPIAEGSQFEALFSHQEATVLAPLDVAGPPVRWRLSVDHWQAGGLQELDVGRIRPFLTGSLGLTRYAADADSEIRFTLGGGGGAKLFPSRHVGVRFDGRIFATFVDVEGRGLACVQGGCVVVIHANIAWQAEFTAGLVVKLR